MSTIRVDNFAPSAGGTTYSADGVAKLWAVLDGSSTLTVRDSLNVSSVVDSGVGYYRANATNAFTSTDYCVTASPFFANAGTTGGGDVYNTSALTTSQVYSLNVYCTTGAARDVGTASMSAKGDLA